jgi:outer membrane protein TolC
MNPRPPNVLTALTLGVLFAVSGTLAQTQVIGLGDALKALPNALDWRSADLTYETAQRNLESAQAAAGIQVSGGTKYDFSQRIDANAQAQNALQVSATASANVLPWSSAAAQIRLAERAFERAGLDRLDARNTLAINLVNQYFTVRGAEIDLELAGANEKLSESQLRVATAQLAAGQISRETFLSAQRGLENARSNTLNVRSAREIARLNLFNTLGQPPSEATASDAPGELETPKENVDALLQTGLERRTDVLKALSRLHDAEDTLAAAQLNRYLPPTSVTVGVGQFAGQTQTGASLSAGINLQSGTASLSGSYPLVAPDPGTNVPKATTFTLSASISLPIIAPSSDANINTAQTSLEAARTALESTRRSAALDVRQKYNDALTAKARLGVSKTALQAAQQSFETAKTRNAAGTNTAIDLETARIATRQAERDLESALVNQLLSVYRLQNALGNLKLVSQGAAQ